jgi:microcystin-dependent protein
MKKIFVLMVLTFQGISLSFGQVGVNTATPDSTAALDIQSPPGGSDNRGVLFPRMSTVQRTGIANPAKSLMVFDTTDMLLYYYDGGRWLGLVPKEPIGTSGAGTPLVNGDITLTTGTISAPNVATSNLTVPGFSNNALVPTGVIVMWSGNPGSIPAGWGLCDGTAGTPNLSGRFIVGYDSGTAAAPATAPNDGSTLNYGTVGNKGGETGHQLTSNEMPSHNHTFSGTTDYEPNHTHDTESYDSRQNNNDGAGPRNDLARPGGSRTSSAAGGHDHTFAGTTSSTGTDQVHENRPPYFVLAYIIKLP